MEQLAKAAAAIEAGNMSEAHVLLAQAIKANPNDVEAWLLLSQTAGSAEQKKTFLKRALIVDPDNETARQRLADLETMPEPTPVVTAAEPSPPAEALPAEDEGPAGPSDGLIPEVIVIEELPTPPSHELADTIIVGAPEVTLATAALPFDVEAHPDVTAPAEAFVDPFDFDSQEEEVPDWLLGEVVAAEAATEVATEPAPETAGEANTVVAEAVSTGAGQPQEVVAPPASQPTTAQAAVRDVGKAEAKKPARSNSVWLEWLIVALVIVLFLTLIYLLAGSG